MVKKLFYFLGEENETVPHIVLKDRESEEYVSTSLDAKTSTYAIAFLAGAINEIAHKRILFKSDNSQALLKLKDRVTECLPGVEYVPKKSPVDDSRANGAAENAVKVMEGMIRTLKTATEDKYGCRLDDRNCLRVWMPRH